MSGLAYADRIADIFVRSWPPPNLRSRLLGKSQGSSIGWRHAESARQVAPRLECRCHGCDSLRLAIRPVPTQILENGPPFTQSLKCRPVGHGCNSDFGQARNHSVPMPAGRLGHPSRFHRVAARLRFGGPVAMPILAEGALRFQDCRRCRPSAGSSFCSCHDHLHFLPKKVRRGGTVSQLPPLWVFTRPPGITRTHHVHVLLSPA